MKGMIKALLLSACMVGFASGCMNKEGKKDKIVNPDQTQTMPVDNNSNVSAQSSGKEHPGKAVFSKYCLTCHQADGSGVPGMHPPLGPGSWVEKDPQELIAIMMKGLSGKVDVNGETYNGFMPSQAQLTDEEIADVLSYVRSSFGNNFNPVDVKLVKKVRSGR